MSGALCKKVLFSETFKEISRGFPSSLMNISTSPPIPSQSSSFGPFESCSSGEFESSPTISQSSNDLSIWDSIDQPIDSLAPSVCSNGIRTMNMEEKGIRLALSLHNLNNLARSDVKKILEMVSTELFVPIKTQLQAFNTLLDDAEQRMHLSSIITNLDGTFTSCSEYQIYQWMLRKKIAEPLIQFTINSEITQIFRKGELLHGEKDTLGVLMPLKFQFKSIFEKSDLLLSTLAHMEKVKQNFYLSHFIQGALWQEKLKLFPTQIVIPYFLYIDDAEINNPLGSHTSPISFLYYSFPTVPQESQIYLGALFKQSDYKEYGNEKCLHAIVESLRSLETNGIEIKTSKGLKKVHFVLGLILGDNLGLNSALGFVRSFTANCFCRFCFQGKNETQKAAVECKKYIRNIHNYAEQVIVNDKSITGINSECIFNSIESFHVTTNFSVDAMHDIFEGICHHDMSQIIKYIVESNFMSLEMLNDRVSSFNYGEIEIGNISSSEIKVNYHLKKTASEMMTFVRLFPLMVGDKIPENDPVWNFLLNLLELIDSNLSYSHSYDSVDRMRELIRKHNSDYVLLFKDTLKPKMHLLVHYPSVIKQSGPTRNFWCFRFESMHKEFKTYARSITSRKNICLTLAKKYQFKFAQLLLNENSDQLYSVRECHRIDSTKYTQQIKIYMEALNIECDSFSSYNQCVYRGHIFKSGYYLCERLAENENDTRVFRIREVFICKEGSNNQNFPYAVIQRVEVLRNHRHYASIEINADDYSGQMDVLRLDSCNGLPLNVHVISRGLQMLRPKMIYNF